ncbi:DNA polymerase [Pararhizobium capsulatum DSM 1112]|uniref:Type-4 uracil-DNA glycosylase n=1 Tax=Pararhizobium capsulatum DSM 1112 TaxID=1121113 RepID=A0ABU0BMZ4_9HYPH|nr:uracil-DNA glycosylase [Pararhizobium capsulatum]MDQ0319635.1 DNA polymerase [Pararhizobium capsulatum DSM 1112]
MISIDQMSPAELAALLHFHAEAGVEWLLEDDPIDRFAEFSAARAARGASRQAPPVQHGTRSETQPRPQREAERAAPRNDQRAAPAPSTPVPATPVAAIPHEQAVSEARFAAESARSLAELKTAMDGFSGCNLRNSAKNLVFADGNPATGVMVIGPMPNADDDRDGLPFSGKQGQMLERMLAAIGLDRATALLSNVIPWRPPGNRVPSQRESEICRPFIERQIALAEPKHLLILGNFTARFFFGSTDTIHHMRGEWRDLDVAGMRLRALATLHPQDLLSAPASKRLAWQDLLAFKAELRD